MYEAQNSKFDFRSLLALLAVLDHLECSTLIEFQDAFEIYSSFFEHQPDKNVFRDKILDVDKGLVCCYSMHPFDKVTYISLRQCNVSKKELFLNLTVSNDEFTFTSNINGLQYICKNTVENETNNIDIDQVCNIGVKLAKALFVLFEKNVFTHTAKCLILENVCDSVEERYWALYESSHEC
ncbi:unnamed protein product [Mytilus edulis]|uniref:Uncharacterized protein n=1 Tax=Mytilus edulis TaxID=6550 RepID=A0A8S3SLV4_MYTED|nr:unnamed protein product [Mytilus edulis]